MSSRLMWRMTVNSKERGSGGGKKLEAVGKGRAPCRGWLKQQRCRVAGALWDRLSRDLTDTPETQPE